jgi:hypothetical protein
MCLYSGTVVPRASQPTSPPSLPCPASCCEVVVARNDHVHCPPLPAPETSLPTLLSLSTNNSRPGSKKPTDEVRVCDNCFIRFVTAELAGVRACLAL